MAKSATSVVETKKPKPTGQKAASSRQKATSSRQRSHGFADKYLATPSERISMIRAGVHAEDLIRTSTEMGVSKERILTMLNVPRSTFNRRQKAGEVLSAEHSERIINLQKLIGQVEIIVSESGTQQDFDAALWLANWLEQTIPALDNLKPVDYLDTIEGMELLSSLIAKMQSGAYA